MRFQRDHPILTEFLREMSSSFDGTDWGSNGPMLVSRVLLRVCKTETLDELTPQKCLVRNAYRSSCIVLSVQMQFIRVSK
jgi:hypothetical protein